MKQRILAFFLVMLSAQAQALQDPTRPSGQQDQPGVVAEPQSFGLVSILYGPDRRVAVIDGVPRSEGETFDGVRVKRIHPGRVELVVNGQVQEVHLAAPPSIRTSK